jgi:aspartate dehydrogenase
MRVGLIGLGAIACGVLELLTPEDDIDVVGALVADPSKPRAARAPKICQSVADLIRLRPEVVVEAAGHAALRCCGPPILRAGIDLIMLSVGALADADVERDIRDSACAGHSHALAAAGAIGALDALAAASVGGLSRVIHTTRKPAAALLPPEQASALTAPRELYRGSAREGALRFPESINVAAAVSLAGIGLDLTEVCVVADPTVDRNRHEVVAQGVFGELRFEIQNVPTDANPRTGRLVAMSVVHALRRRHTRLAVG